MDMWISNSAGSEEIQSANVLYNAAYTSFASESKAIDSIEVYFLMYIKGTSIESARNSVASASRTIIDYCKNSGRDVKIYFATYTGATVVSKETGNSYVSTVSTDDEINEMLSRVGAASGALDTTNFNYSLTRTLNKNLLEASSINEKSKKYCFVIDVNFQPQSTADVAVVEEMKKNGVDFTFICNDLNDNIINYDALSSSGDHWKWTPNFSENIISKVIGNVITYNVNTGLCNEIPYDIELITSEWKNVYEKFYSGKLSVEEIKKLGLPDTDGDGTLDCLEIFMKYITFDADGKIILPTYEELAKDAMKNSSFGLKGLDELVDIMKKKGINIRDLCILPLISNPAVEDSDSDGIPDIIDERLLEEDIISVDDTIIDDDRVFEDDYKTISNKSVNGNGLAFSHNGALKNNVIEYTRVIRDDGNATTRFYIEPEQNSDYLITIDAADNTDCKIRVTYVSGFIFKREHKVSADTSEIEETNKACYSLKKGVKYKITITVKSNTLSANTYKVSFEQNNWVYASNGGARKFFNHKTTSYMNDFYLTDTYMYGLLKNTLTSGLNNIADLDHIKIKMKVYLDHL